MGQRGMCNIFVGQKVACRWKAMSCMLMLKARRRHGNRVLEFRAWHQCSLAALDSNGSDHDTIIFLAHLLPILDTVKTFH